MRGLGVFPELGRPRHDVGPGCRSLPVGQHVIWYRIEKGTVRILRILHARMDATGRVAAPDAP
jgi:plasmid stabilization system protein ParE